MDTKEITQEIKINDDKEISIFVKNMDIFHPDYTKINGDFKISSENLCKLIPILNEKYVGQVSNKWYMPDGYIMTKDKAIEQITKKLTKSEEDIEKCKKEIDTYKNEIYELYKNIENFKTEKNKLRIFLGKIPKFILKLFLNKKDIEYIKQNN